MISSLQEFVDSLELPFDGEMTSNQYVVFVDNSDDFSSLFNCVSLNKTLKLEDESDADESKSTFRYTDGHYEVTLKADYDNDDYSLIAEVM